MKKLSQAVTDVYPWPNGFGFQDAAAWWEYARSQSEEDKLDLLLATALLSEDVCHLLLNHDKSLFEAFALSEQTVDLLRDIKASNLSAFSIALLLA